MTGIDIKNNRGDSTLNRNTVSYWKNLIKEYELIKNKQHTRFKFVQEFYDFCGIKRQHFIKYYNRYKDSYYYNNAGIICYKEDLLLPQKRGPKYKTRRTLPFLENKVIGLRLNGLSRYEIYSELKTRYNKLKNIPCPSTIYNIFKKNNLNRLKPIMKKNKRKIIKEKIGEMGHIDCHYLPRNIIKNDNKRYYLIGIIDDCSRIIMLNVLRDIKAISVMFATLEIINLLKNIYSIEFTEILTDNGSEFGSGKNAKNKDTHPFERLLKELNIKHRYTRPYRPQTNGKIERFWKTVKDDLIEDMEFDSLEHLKDEVMQYCIYYNEHRPHTSLGGKTPKDVLKKKKEEVK